MNTIHFDHIYPYFQLELFQEAPIISFSKNQVLYSTYLVQLLLSLCVWV